MCCKLFPPSPFLSTLSLPLLTMYPASMVKVSRVDSKETKQEIMETEAGMCMRPILLNVFFSKRIIHANVVHRGTSKVIPVARTNAKYLRITLPSLIDNEVYRDVGRLIAERSMEADVFAVAYEPKKDELIEGRLGIALDTIKDCGNIFV